MRKRPDPPLDYGYYRAAMRWLLLLTLVAYCAGQSDEALAHDPDLRAELGVLSGAVQEGDEQALAELHERAESGEPYAQNLLGNYYSENNADPAALPEAFKWHQRAARQGLRQAQVALAHEYLEGFGVELNQELALAWMQIAAEQGEPQALYDLGSVYRRSDVTVIEKDLIQTYKWWTIMSRRAAEGKLRSSLLEGVVAAVLEHRDRLAEQLTPEQIAEAERLAEEWRPKSWEELRLQMPPL